MILRKRLRRPAAMLSHPVRQKAAMASLRREAMAGCGAAPDAEGAFGEGHIAQVMDFDSIPSQGPLHDRGLSEFSR